MTQEEDFKAAGEAIRKIREAQGRSQEDIAFEVGMDQSTLSKMERLGPPAISWSKFIKVAQALGCTIQVSLKPKSSDS